MTNDESDATAAFPVDVDSEAFSAAVATHELFMTYVAVGFTRPEALQIVMFHLARLMDSGDTRGA